MPVPPLAPAAGRSLYRGYRFPPEVIAHTVWLSFRFHLSFRDVQDLLAERGIVVSHEAIRQWCTKFGPGYAAGPRRRRGRPGDKWLRGGQTRAASTGGIAWSLRGPTARAQPQSVSRADDASAQGARGGEATLTGMRSARLGRAARAGSVDR